MLKLNLYVSNDCVELIPRILKIFFSILEWTILLKDMIKITAVCLFTLY
jgi:hypothetical protein